VVGVALVAFLYAASLFCPAFEFRFDERQHVLSGWEAFIFLPRCVAFIDAVSQMHLVLAWLPNLLLLVGVVGLLLGSRRTALLASVFALLGGLYVPGYFLYPSDSTFVLGAGYYLWMASMAVLAGLSQVGERGGGGASATRLKAPLSSSLKSWPSNDETRAQ
jgi:hypothetical protein